MKKFRSSTGALLAILVVLGVGAARGEDPPPVPPAEAETPQATATAAEPAVGEPLGEEKPVFNRLRRPRKAEPKQAEPEVQPEVQPEAQPEAQVEQTPVEAEFTEAPDLDDLVAVATRLKDGPVGKDRVASAYLDLAIAREATPAQMNDFASYLVRRGLLRDALVFQRAAVGLDETNPTLWVNLGSIQNGLNRRGSAASAFKRAIDLDYGNAFAHYNLGAVYDADRRYDDAIEEYKIALTLDPSLADPRKNPQVINNKRLLAVTLMLYRDRAGSAALPLIPMQPAEPSDRDK